MAEEFVRSMRLSLAALLAAVLCALLGAVFSDSLPIRALSLAGILASFLVVLFGQLVYLDRSPGASRLRQTLLISIGFGLLLIGGGIVGGVDAAVGLGMRVAMFGVVLAILRTDYVVFHRMVGPQVANVAATILAVAAVLQEAAMTYPAPGLSAAVSVARLAGALIVFVGFVRAMLIAFRRASGRTT